MQFRPLHDHVVVRRIDAEERSAGGIVIPDTAKEKPQKGEVIAVGPGARDDSGKLVPLDVKGGDRRRAWALRQPAWANGDWGCAANTAHSMACLSIG